MSSGLTAILGHNRQHAHALVDRAPPGSVMTIKGPKRTLDQNDKMHAMLTDVARSKWEATRYDKDDWKLIFMRALMKEEPRYLTDLDGQIFPAGYRSSKLTKAQMADLITLIQAWGDQNGVRWTEPTQEAA